MTADGSVSLGVMIGVFWIREWRPIEWHQCRQLFICLHICSLCVHVTVVGWERRAVTYNSDWFCADAWYLLLSLLFSLYPTSFQSSRHVMLQRVELLTVPVPFSLQTPTGLYTACFRGTMRCCAWRVDAVRVRFPSPVCVDSVARSLVFRDDRRGRRAHHSASFAQQDDEGTSPERADLERG